MTKKRFIDKIAGYVKEYAPKYGISVQSPIIAQAILESGWGKSTLASKYHNYFGLKCGTLWTGKSVNMTTNEEYKPGTLTTIRDNFRVYDSMEEGVRGYFEFIQLARYQNLRGITDQKAYLETIKNDGYATASDYVSSNMEIIKQYNLTQYDTQEEESMTKKQAITKITKIAEGEIGYLEKKSESNLDSKTANAGSNNYTKYWRDMEKLGLGDYQGGYWCAAFIAWIFYIAFGLKIMQKLLLQKFFINCQTMANLAAAKGQLYDAPQAGDIVLFYNGREYYHTGYVVNVKSGIMTTIEGNTSGGSSVIANGGGVAKKTYRISSLNAKFFRPAYEIVTTGNTDTNANAGTGLNKAPQFVGKVTASELNVRTWAGTENAKIKAYPKLLKGNLVDVCDTVKASDGSGWHYVRIAGKYYGFVSAKYIKRV